MESSFYKIESNVIFYRFIALVNGTWHDYIELYKLHKQDFEVNFVIFLVNRRRYHIEYQDEN